MIDAHCHLAACSAEALGRARRAGVEGAVLAGTGPADWGCIAARVAQIAALPLAACYGLHPAPAARLDEAGLEAALVELAARLEASPAAALGECGLDRRYGAPQRQERAFLRQLDLARRRALPVVVHCVGRYGRLRELLAAAPRGPVLLHGYAGPAELVPAFARLGCSFSFGGPLTWPGARRAPEAAAAVPEERVLVETDAPFRPPEPYRTGPGAPAQLVRVVAALAALRGGHVREWGERTAANARRFFGWAQPSSSSSSSR